MKDQNSDYDFEEWEGDYELIEEEDWVGLLKLRKWKAENRPEDLYAQLEYADALNLNRKFEQTIKFLKPLYEKYYQDSIGVREILDALYGLGLSENDFNWFEKPKILKLDQVTLTLCIKFLNGKRKHRDIPEIYTELLLQAEYCKFNEQGLADFLTSKKEIFDIQGEIKYFWDTELKLKRKK